MTYYKIRGSRRYQLRWVAGPFIGDGDDEGDDGMTSWRDVGPATRRTLDKCKKMFAHSARIYWEVRIVVNVADRDRKYVGVVASAPMNCYEERMWR